MANAKLKIKAPSEGENLELPLEEKIVMKVLFTCYPEINRASIAAAIAKVKELLDEATSAEEKA